MSANDEARAEAEKRWPEDEREYGASGLGPEQMKSARRSGFAAGAEWQASRKVDAAPSDTDREALRRVAELASGDHITESLAEYRDATSPDSEPTEWELEFWHAGYKRGALSIIDHLAASQSVQVEVTDDMVERGAAEKNRIQFVLSQKVLDHDLKLVRAILSAALGGGEK